jgi:Transposase
MGNCAGVDWAADKHDVRVCDETGEELLAATFAHDERGLRALCRALLLVQHQFSCEVACRSCLKRAISGSGGGSLV